MDREELVRRHAARDGSTLARPKQHCDDITLALSGTKPDIRGFELGIHLLERATRGRGTARVSIAATEQLPEPCQHTLMVPRPPFDFLLNLANALCQAQEPPHSVVSISRAPTSEARWRRP